MVMGLRCLGLHAAFLRVWMRSRGRGDLDLVAGGGSAAVATAASIFTRCPTIFWGLSLAQVAVTARYRGSGVWWQLEERDEMRERHSVFPLQGNGLICSRFLSYKSKRINIFDIDSSFAPCKTSGQAACAKVSLIASPEGLNSLIGGWAHG